MGAEFWTLASVVEYHLGLIQMTYQKTAKQCRLVDCSCSVPMMFCMCAVGPGALRIGGPCIWQALPTRGCWMPQSPPSHYSVSKRKWTLYSYLWQGSTGREKDQIVCFGKGRKGTNIWIYFLCTSQDAGYFYFILSFSSQYLIAIDS